MAARADPDLLRGASAALQHAFTAKPTDPDRDAHLRILAAEADFAALRAQLNDPPPQYDVKAKP